MTTTKKSRSGPGASAVLPALRLPVGRVIDVGAGKVVPSRRDLGRRWFIAVTSGETLGFAVLASVAALTVDSAPGVIAAALLMAGAVEGGVLGWFQARVLRSRLQGFSARDWVAATVVGAVVAWTVGLVPVLYGDRIGDWPIGIQMPTVSAGAIVMVFALGVAQWYVLRRWSDLAVLWIWANAVGWITGLSAFMVLTGPLWRPGQSAVATAAIGVLAGLVMAAVMAATTGAFLVRILEPGHLRAFSPTCPGTRRGSKLRGRLDSTATSPGTKS
ncbi:hypothetical protein IU479_33955 [Nocardia abscessus]|uniref:hypothetical protein n=1 Tax=Nocardia TaxID=1817 RepID=UPI0018953139|nr:MULTISPECIES: hypothetical protein [Nocardia]MBF6223088.1 hypothetical protein [Nocardia abscessus]MDE1673904.1 hypothetical protein [Nocardia gipuzkoensis]